MRSRPSARLLILDGGGRLLLFKFTHLRGALSGQVYWATPGGGLEPGETFEAAAVRELCEETGLVIGHPGPEVARRRFPLQLPDGEWVAADERYFVIRVEDLEIGREGWTDLEREVMTEHRWWTLDELAGTGETVWPADVAALIP